MGLGKRFLNLLTDDTAEKTVPDTADDSGGFDWLQSLFSKARRGRSLESITYYSCMRIRCDAIAKLPLKVMRHLDKGGTELVTDNEVYRLLKLRPNKYMGIYDFLF